MFAAQWSTFEPAVFLAKTVALCQLRVAAFSSVCKYARSFTPASSSKGLILLSAVT